MNRQSFYVGVKVIVSRGDEVLILQDAGRGKWEVPGGRIDGSQSIEEAISREIPEEIEGAKLIKLGGLLHAAVGDFMVENDHRLCLLFYKAEIALGGPIVLSEEHSDFAWVKGETLDEYDMYVSDRIAIMKYFEALN